MTFYEAALRVLESAGRPLHVREITEQSIAQNMLSHVGKAPDKTMLSRLAAMARRTRDRRVIVTAKDTFALAEWAIPEDVEALGQTGVAEPNPEESLPALRPAERHPDARPENVRASGRPADRRRRHEEEEARGWRRRHALPEVVLSVLSDAAAPLKPAQIAELMRERDPSTTEVTGEQILAALFEENQHRLDAGRRLPFAFSKETGEVSLEPPGREAASAEVQAAFAAALGISLEGGRPILPRAAGPGAAEALEAANSSVWLAAKDARRAAARELRRRLLELDLESFHKAFVKVLQALGFRELKVAKRSRDGVLLTARKRDGSVDHRFAVRLLRGSTAIDRRAVQELRRDLGHYSAQAGLIASAGELRGDARSEAQSPGGLTALWCADALADKFIEAGSAVTARQVHVFEIDDRFFAAARIEAEQVRRRRDERLRERQERRPPEEGDRGPHAPEEVGRSDSSPDGAAIDTVLAKGDEAALSPAAAAESAGEPVEAEEEVGGDLDVEETGSPRVTPAAAVDRKRRRRRRRGRRGRRPPEAGAIASTPQSSAPAAAPSEEKSEQPPSQPENESS